MHFTAYKSELVKSFQRIILGRKPRSKTQLQSNANGLKNLPVKYGQVKGLVKRKPFILIPFQSDRTKPARFLC